MTMCSTKRKYSDWHAKQLAYMLYECDAMNGLVYLNVYSPWTRIYGCNKCKYAVWYDLLQCWSRPGPIEIWHDFRSIIENMDEWNKTNWFYSKRLTQIAAGKSNHNRGFIGM